MEQPKLFLTEEKTLNEILNYLSTKPYAEVAGLIAKVQKSTPYNPKPLIPEDQKEKKELEGTTKKK